MLSLLLLAPPDHTVVFVDLEYSRIRQERRTLTSFDSIESDEIFEGRSGSFCEGTANAAFWTRRRIGRREG